MKKIFFFLCCLSLGYLTAEEAAQETSPPAPDVAKISEAFGHLLGKNLDSMGMKLDIAKVIQGLQDAAAHKEAPMTEVECIEAITAVQEAAFKETAQQNLKQAEEFLVKNQTSSEIHSLENGKLQYRITQEGKGACVSENSTPLIRYVGKFIDGSTFDSSKEEEMINLDEALSGFSKGLLGMKEGEKRVLYIHPDLGYGTRVQPPNSLLTFEVEVVQANAPHPEALDSLTPITPKSNGNPEIASPFEEPKVVR